MTQRKAADRFWDFALSVYGRDAPRAAFLRLQDEGGADVPMLLWCLWLAHEGRSVSPDAMTGAVAFSRAWRAAMVDPLRRVRRTVKPGIDAVPDVLTEEGRALVAQTEQALERMQMTHLAQIKAAEGKADPGDNLLLYADVAGLSLDPDDLATIALP